MKLYSWYDKDSPYFKSEKNNENLQAISKPSQNQKPIVVNNTEPKSKVTQLPSKPVLV